MPRNGGGAGIECGGSSNGSGKSSSTKVFQTMEEAIMSDGGVTFDVRYIGCLEIKSSMKTLEFATRSHVAK